MSVFAFVALAGARGRSVTADVDAIARDGTRLLPIRTLSFEIASWVAPSKRLALVVWSLPDAPNVAPGLVTAPRHATAVAGTGGIADFSDAFAPAPSIDRLRRARDTVALNAGSWAYIHVDDRLDAMVAGTTVTGVDPIYWARGDGLIAVGNRALLVHRTTATGRFPDYDLRAIATFVNTGFYLDGTPFRAVHRLGASQFVEVVGGRPRTGQLPTPGRDPAVADADPRHLDLIAEAFVGAFGQLGDAPSVKLGLTGGKDSRLILAGLLAADIDVRAETHSYADANMADVHVARLVARAAGVEHRITSIDGGEVAIDPLVTVDLRRRTRDCILLTEGMSSAYENIGFVPTRYDPTPNLGGHGGELLRAGIALAVPQPHANSCMPYLERNLRPHGDLLTAPAKADLDDVVDCWLSSTRALSPTEMLTRFHLDFKVGRWSGAARGGYLASRNQLQPLFDNRLVRLALQVEVRQRLDDRVVHGILRRLAPGLVEVPFANDYWRWQSAPERDQLTKTFPDAYVPRRPRPGLRNLDWRLTYSTQLRNELESIIFEAPGSLLFEVVDQQRLRDLWSGPQLANPAFKYLAYNLCTVAILLNENWIDNAGVVGHPVLVDADDLPR
jgi:hypothetical protein